MKSICFHAVDIRTSKPLKNFCEFLFEGNSQQLPGSKILNALENKSFAVYFIHLRLRREPEEDYMEVGESKAGIRL